MGPSNGVHIRDDGYAKVSDLLGLQEVINLKITRQELCKVVADNEKGRFQMMTDRDGEEWIRTTQGHGTHIGIDMEKYVDL